MECPFFVSSNILVYLLLCFWKFQKAKTPIAKFDRFAIGRDRQNLLTVMMTTPTLLLYLTAKKSKRKKKVLIFLNFFVWFLLYFLNTFFFLSFRKRKSQRPKTTGLQAKKIRHKPTSSQAQKIRSTDWGGFNVLKITLLALYWWIQKGQKRFATIYLFQTWNFQLIGHFVSTHLWVDSECPTFFWPVVFSFYHLLIFGCFSKHDTIFIFSLLGISCLLIFEWIRNALFFFLVRRFFILTLV